MHSDGSIGMLHVEPEFRRRGIAQILMNRLIRERANTESTGELLGLTKERRMESNSAVRGGGALGWNWVDVVESNKEGSRFFKSLGGWAEGWTSLWLFLTNENDKTNHDSAEGVE
jgi:GNAT superfamily N-acetyltransferase